MAVKWEIEADGSDGLFVSESSLLAGEEHFKTIMASLRLGSTPTSLFNRTGQYQVVASH